MVKNIIIFILLTTISFGNIYEQNCIKCHKRGPSLKKIYFDYLLKYSSEKRVKKAMIEYVKNPNSKKSIMPKSYIKKHQIKCKSRLTLKQLKKAINIYWKLYSVKGKIK